VGKGLSGGGQTRIRYRQTFKTLESRVEATQPPKAEEGSAYVSTTGKNSADEEEIDFNAIEAELAALEAEEARREEEYCDGVSWSLAPYGSRSWFLSIY
jgi:hypothetical protein